MEQLVEQFFNSNDPPATLSKDLERVENFLQKHSSKPVVLVTSGGTTVPLEKNTVRFIDNFSGGSRGSISTEIYLEHGYAVIFLYRKSTFQPFIRHLQHDPLLDEFEVEENNDVVLKGNEKVANSLRQYAKYKDSLLKIQFVSVHDYLYQLKGISSKMNQLGEKAMIYAAAAVSDFYIPHNVMTQHKIQSKGGGQGLNLELAGTPKLLGSLKSEWCPKAYVVTFKLETDTSMLDQKVKKSKSSYHQDAVVGNMLGNYKEQVTLYLGSDEGVVVKKPADVDTVEHMFVGKLIECHKERMSNKK